MSGDDTVGVVAHGNFWYVGIFFADNYNRLLDSGKKFDNLEDALLYARVLDDVEHTEYGVLRYNDSY